MPKPHPIRGRIPPPRELQHAVREPQDQTPRYGNTPAVEGYQDSIDPVREVMFRVDVDRVEGDGLEAGVEGFEVAGGG